MSFCRLSTRREEAKKEFQTPIINLNKARSFEEGDDDQEEHKVKKREEQQKLIGDHGSVFDFEQQSGKSFVSSRTLLIQTPIRPIAQKILHSEEYENDFDDLVKLVKELIEERKKLKLKVSLDSDMRFMQEWGKYDSPKQFLTKFTPEYGFRNPSRRSVKFVPNHIASLFNITEPTEERVNSKRSASRASLKSIPTNSSQDYYESKSALKFNKKSAKESDSQERRARSRSEYSKCWFISRSDWKKKQEGGRCETATSGKTRLRESASLDKRNFIKNPTHSLSGMVRDIMKLPRGGETDGEVQKIEQLYNLVELCENLSLRDEKEYYSVISEWSRIQRRQSEQKISSLAKGIKGISDLSRKDSSPLESSTHRGKEDEEKNTLDMIKILADIARSSRTKQRLIKEKFERTDMLLTESKERQIARVLEASDSMKQRNYKRNSQRLQSFLNECKKKRLLEIK